MGKEEKPTEIVEEKNVRKQKYSIKPEFVGMTIWTSAPVGYKRKDGGKFVLNDKLSVKDLQYLYEVQNVRKEIIKN